MISFNYLKIIIFMCLSFGLAVLLFVVSLNISSKEYDAEKLSAYECGFLPVGDARQPFHVRFYLVGILFLLFDLEVIFIFPWAIGFDWLNPIELEYSFKILMYFLILLTIGYVYEWEKGALDWE